jgi:cytochrome c oxidase subunit 2
MMRGRVVVMEPLDYQRWLSGAAGGQTPVAQGERLFEKLGCGSCHSPESGARGPDLRGLFGKKVHVQGGAVVVADENYLRESILAPNARLTAGYDPIMPTYQGQLSEESLMALVAYLRALEKK